mmetsp:Transcript_96665/g.186411  ORF Transcript_96665/g.186411 Transcript_96665/m.186411 type:complete len:324 (+) Transcript_96665:87-1058(+)
MMHQVQAGIHQRPRSLTSKLFLTCAAAGAAALAIRPWFSSPEELAFVLLPGGMPVAPSNHAPTSLIARCAEEEAAEVEAVEGEEAGEEQTPEKTCLTMWKDWRELKPIRRKFRGSYDFETYGDFTYKRKAIPQMRIRLARWGKVSQPYYRIIAAHQKPKAPRSERYYELLGHWDSIVTLEDPKAFEIKADRVVYWLRRGAQPTDMVANLLDRIGIIRRTGPQSRLGEWEWRIPTTSGPEAPEGWKWDGIQKVTWGNRPMKKDRKGKPMKMKDVNKARDKNRPLIEKNGFRGYARIPIDHEVMSEPVTEDRVIQSFKNTRLPVY